MLRFIYCCYQLVVALPLFILSTILTALITSIGSVLGSAHFWGYYPARLWSRFVCRLLLLQVESVGREKLTKGQSYVFVANHQGAMDIFLVYGYLNRNFKWMMKKALRRLPFVGYACYKARHIFVDKSSPRKVKATIDFARKTLQGGTSLVVFPEGARTFTGHLGVFRKGAFQLADDLQLPIVPMTINGSFDILPRTKGFNFVRHHKLQLLIHDPIYPTSRSAEDILAIKDQAYDAIMRGLPPHYQGYVKNDDQ